MKSILLALIFCLTSFTHIIGQNYKILESDSKHIILEFNFEKDFRIIDTLIDGNQFQLIKGKEFSFHEPGQPWLPDVQVQLGIPFESKPSVRIIRNDKVSFKNKIIPPLPFEDPEFYEYDFTKRDQKIYSKNEFFPSRAAIAVESFIVRYAKILPVTVAPYQYNPVTRELIFNKLITLRVDYNDNASMFSTPIQDPMTNDLIKSTVINYEQAKNWTSKSVEGDLPVMNGSEWYDPTKTYYKVYLKEKGVYRLSYDYLIGLNVPVQSVQTNKLQVFSGETEVPLYINDINDNGIFENGDYLEFVGYPPSPSPYSGLNIYNLENVSWFSFEADTSGLRYNPKDAYPNNWVNSFQSVTNTLHYEVDTLYERLGHADNNERDYWYWANVSGSGGVPTKQLDAYFPFPKNITPYTNLVLRVNMHGLAFKNCNPDHKAKVYFTNAQFIGEHTWDGYTPTTYSTTVDLTQIQLFETNQLTVQAFGDLPPCPPELTTYDEFLVNWFEIEYQMNLKADENNIFFLSPPNLNGLTKIEVFNWLRDDDMKIFVPEHNEMLINPLFTYNQYHSVIFVDDLYERTEYFCVAEDYFLLPDSVVKDRNASDLRNINNGADYIIITHPNFMTVAERLANFRSSNFPDTSITTPRIKIVVIEDIYDEFSYGLMDPYAIQYFNKYAFDNWALTAPSYVVLLGDMSYDYRSLLPESRPNFIPSIPYHTLTYGQAASDNLFVTVSGNDVKPDIAIGRLSCETVEEGNILVDKIINYPADNSKKWKQNVLLMSSGIDENDELLFGFNDANLLLDNSYLIPNGISSTKVFRYPTKPEHLPFQGEGAEIRQGFNDGAVLASYYGHGGGYQWDLVFNNDDIYELENGGRLPFISSVTCYTAHFDNQDVFGEQFNKVPGKGSISFFGSSGLTYWGVGRQGNQFMFEEIFNHKSAVSGKFILATKTRMGNAGQINLLTLLGDPVLKLALPDNPDFVILPSDISIEPETPLVNDTVAVKVKIKNYGVVFPGDSVVVQLFASSQDTSYTMAEIKRGSFGEIDSVIVSWIPNKGGLYTLTARVNEIEIIPEMDHSDNEASALFAVFDLGEPSIVDPINGYVLPDSTIKFLFIDNGYYVYKDVKYQIEIDTSLNFTTPIIKSSLISPQRGLMKWESSVLQEGKYFWRAKVIVEEDSTVWNSPRVLSVEYDSIHKGYNISARSLLSLDKHNMNYSYPTESLVLNTDTLPPRPSNDTFEEFIEIELPSDILGLSNITTDGTYIYFAQDNQWVGSSVSKIYKLGTGFNGTTRGQNYGSIPNIEVPISNQMFYFVDGEGGYIYVATGSAYTLLKIDPENGDTSRVQIPDGMLNATDGLVHDGSFYVTSDGRYIYNLAYINEVGDYKYTIRKFDPLNNWFKVGEDIVPTGSSTPHFKYFFVGFNFLYAYENYNGGFLRRINLETGIYEEEWVTLIPFQGFFAWTYDRINNKVYTSAFRGDYEPKFGIYAGAYLDANGTVTSHKIGPSAEWNNLEYLVDAVGSTGTYQTYLYGLSKATKLWDTLYVNPPAQLDLSSVNADEYPFLQLKFSLTDTSFGATEPIKVKSMSIDYETPPELMVIRDDILFEPDTILQGFDTQLSSKFMNIGKRPADQIKGDYYFNTEINSPSDSILFSRTIAIAETSSVIFLDTLQTSSRIFKNEIKTVLTYSGNEFFTFNNVSANNYFVARDSIRPLFHVTFDGQEIIDNDIVSSEPEVEITLEDNSPLPLDTSYFTIVHTERDVSNIPKVIRFSDPDIEYTITYYPNSKVVITWTPELADGEHVLEILAKDASGNFFDSTSYRIIFNVYTDNDITEVYNYPNPFADQTHFTFLLRGLDKPDELDIKIYTVAGRLIRDISVSQSQLITNFNKISWDGRDQDGDEIGNGVYFYKVIAKFPDKTKTITQKLAKVK